MKIVVKVGTSSLAHSDGSMNEKQIATMCSVLAKLKAEGHQIVLVSSGAIGMGVGKLRLPGRPDDMPTKQAAAAVGQCELMYTYDRLFSTDGITVAQILLTGTDIHSEDRLSNFQNTINRLLDLGVLPVVNENDTVATDEIVIGDNDTLAAIVAVNISAELLVLLSDIDGLYTEDPHRSRSAKLIERVEHIGPELIAIAGGCGSSLGTGGMHTKLTAAQMCTSAGCDMIISNGIRPELLYNIDSGIPFGTRFVSEKGAVSPDVK